MIVPTAIVDVGDGPAGLITHLSAVNYIGRVPNPAYVEIAMRTNAARGNCRFDAGYFGEKQATQLEHRAFSWNWGLPQIGEL